MDDYGTHEGGQQSSIPLINDPIGDISIDKNPVIELTTNIMEPKRAPILKNVSINTGPKIAEYDQLTYNVDNNDLSVKSLSKILLPQN